MKNYMYLYQSQNDAVPTPEDLQVWATWFDTLGNKVISSGNPFNNGNKSKAVLRNGGSTVEDDSTLGYSVVKANSLDEAIRMAMSCPLVNAPGCAVRVYEAAQM